MMFTTLSPSVTRKSGPIVLPLLAQRRQVPRRRQQLDPRREPQRQSAQQRHFHVRPQRMPLGAFPRDLAEFLVQA